MRGERREDETQHGIQSYQTDAYSACVADYIVFCPLATRAAASHRRWGRQAARRRRQRLKARRAASLVARARTRAARTAGARRCSQ